MTKIAWMMTAVMLALGGCVLEPEHDPQFADPVPYTTSCPGGNNGECAEGEYCVHCKTDGEYDEDNWFCGSKEEHDEYDDKECPGGSS